VVVVVEVVVECETYDKIYNELAWDDIMPVTLADDENNKQVLLFL
jgi:hypothetical protein